MNLYRFTPHQNGAGFTRPPLGLRRAKLDNLALVPASLLPFKAKWQRLANDLPEGNILIILPETK